MTGNSTFGMKTNDNGDDGLGLTSTFGGLDTNYVLVRHEA